MSSILNHFGITQKLLSDDLLYERIVRGNEMSSAKKIEEVLKRITPVECGIPLIRIGPNRDGGYLVPDDLQGIEACFSPGTNNFKDFEDDLSKRYGIKAFMCDYSSDVSKLRTPLIDGLQFFEKKWLDVEESEISLDLNNWVAANSTVGSDLLLQMDIEGAEYRNLIHVSPEILAQFRIIILEVHNLGLLSRIEFLEGVFIPVLNKINGFECVHAHPNNCCGNTVFSDGLVVSNVLELTFLRKDRLKNNAVPIELPNKLDVLNVASHKPLFIEGVLLKNADYFKSEINRLNQIIDWQAKGIENLSWRFSELEKMSEIGLYLSSISSGEKNIAKGKIATQSSISIYSTSEGACGAINGIKTGRFGFHTDIEDCPWWMVDLGSQYDLVGILVYNRIDACQERIKTLRILTSLDGVEWGVVYDHNSLPPFGGRKPYNGAPPLLVSLEKIKSRFVKLELREKNILHLDQVEIFGLLSGTANPPSTRLSASMI